MGIIRDLMKGLSLAPIAKSYAPSLRVIIVMAKGAKTSIYFYNLH